MTILDGKKTAQHLFEKIQVQTQRLEQKPHLCAVIVGEDPASKTYVNAKMRACKKVGFNSSVLSYSENIKQEALLLEIEKLNNDDQISGFIVQLPLPSHIDAKKIILAIDPKKDVDGFHPENIGKMTIGLQGLKPATPSGILELLKFYDIETEGKNCVVLGRSNIVGMPISIMLAQKAKPGNCTITICHSRTQNLASITQKADILIVAMGKKEAITADMIKENAVIIDVGIHREDDPNTKKGYVLKGDVCFRQVAEKSSYITPVPGGVGPLTIASLLKNTLKAHTQNFDF